jgi:hypothetical protein
MRNGEAVLRKRLRRELNARLPERLHNRLTRRSAVTSERRPDPVDHQGTRPLVAFVMPCEMNVHVLLTRERLKEIEHQ